MRNALQHRPLNALDIAQSHRWMLRDCDALVVPGQSKPVNLAHRGLVTSFYKQRGSEHGLAIDTGIGTAAGHGTIIDGAPGLMTEMTIAAVCRPMVSLGDSALIGNVYGNGTQQGYTLYFNGLSSIELWRVPDVEMIAVVPSPALILSHWYAVIARSSAGGGARLYVKDLTAGNLYTGTGTHTGVTIATSGQIGIGYDGATYGEGVNGMFTMAGYWHRAWTVGQMQQFIYDPMAFLRKRREPTPRYRAPGGIAYTQGITGAVTPAGTENAASARALAGAATPAGLLSRAESRALAGALTPAGVEHANTSRSLAGAITPAGVESFARLYQRALAAGITPAGLLSRVEARALAGGITPSGAISKKTARSLAGGFSTVQLSGKTVRSAARAFAGVITTLFGYIGRDSVTRANSTTTITAAPIEMGGNWTVRQGVNAWGVTSQRGYNTQTATAVSNIITQTYAVTPGEVGVDFATDAINTHVMVPVPLLVDANNFVSIGLIAGAVIISSKVGGSAVSRVTIPQTSTGLPASGAASGTISVTYDKNSWTLQVLLNGSPISGASYTLTTTEHTAYGTALQAGILSSWASGTATASTWKNFYARSSSTNASLARLVSKLFGGGLTPTGAIARLLGRVFSGSATPSGPLSKNTARPLVGGLTPSATLDSLKGALKSLSGAIAPIGALARATQKLFSGAISPSGTVSKATSRPLSGVLTPSGALATLKGAVKSLSATIAPTATLARRAVRALAGAIVPAGVATKRTARSLAGSVAPAGSLTRTGGRVLAALLHPLGVAKGAASKRFAASLAPGGALSSALISVESAGRRILALFRAIR